MSSTDPSLRPADSGLAVRRHAGELIRLAVPVVISRAGMIVMAITGSILVGRHSVEELAYFGLSTVPLGPMFSAGTGLLLGTIVMTAHARGGGRNAECGAVWRNSLPYALFIGLVYALICQFGETLFATLGQSPELAAGGSRVLAVHGIGMPAAMLFLTTSLFLEGIKRPVPGMVVMLAGNAINLGLAWLLVHGGFGIPAMGATGAAWATAATRWFMAAALILYALSMRDRAEWAVAGSLRGWWRDGGGQRRLGYAAGLSQAVESTAFASLGIFAGWLGTEALAAYTVGFNLIAFPFMAAVGLGVATGVRVGEAYGRGDRADAAMAGWTGLGVTSAVLSAVALCYLLFPDGIAEAFSRDGNLQDILRPVVAFSALILVVDGGQVVMASALRARHDAWIPTALHFVSYFAVMMPASAGLALWLGHGVLGLFQGIFLASVLSVGVLSARFHLLSQRERGVRAGLASRRA